MGHQKEMNCGKGRKKGEFASTLQQLKQNGCTLLVVGRVPDFVYKAVCRKVMGDSTHAMRRRLFIATDREVATACTLLSTVVSQVDPTTVQVLSVASETRHATTPAQPSQTAIPIDHITGTDLADLGIAISEAIADFEDQGLAPAELRVCLDSLAPLVDRGDRDTLFRFLDLLNTRIRGVGGMGQVYLDVERDRELVYLLESVFDAVIELRMRDGDPEQRWHLTETDITSEWLSCP